MGVREETLQALRSGQTPGQISHQRGVSLQTTLQYLNQMVGEGRLRRSDILFAVPREVRKAIADNQDSYLSGIDLSDIKVVQLYGDAAHALGDMYDDLRDIEMALHGFIKTHLKKSLGDSETGWWRKGIPEAIRKACQTRREEDSEPATEAYSYTDLIDLGRIIEQNWSTFQAYMPDLYKNNRKRLLEDLRHLNVIRRMVMHPVRCDVPTENDFDFVRDLKLALLTSCQRTLSDSTMPDS